MNKCWICILFIAVIVLSSGCASKQTLTPAQQQQVDTAWLNNTNHNLEIVAGDASAFKNDSENISVIDKFEFDALQARDDDANYTVSEKYKQAQHDLYLAMVSFGSAGMNKHIMTVNDATITSQSYYQAVENYNYNMQDGTRSMSAFFDDMKQIDYNYGNESK